MTHQFKVGDLVIRHPDFIGGWPQFSDKIGTPLTVAEVHPVDGNLKLKELPTSGTYWSSRFLPFQPIVEGNVEDFA